MEEIPANQLIQLRLVGYPIIYSFFLHPRWCRISSINSIAPSGKLTCPTYGRGNIIFPATLKGDMLVPWRVYGFIWNPKRNEQKGWDDVDVCFFLEIWQLHHLRLLSLSTCHLYQKQTGVQKTSISWVEAPAVLSIQAISVSVTVTLRCEWNIPVLHRKNICKSFNFHCHGCLNTNDLYMIDGNEIRLKESWMFNLQMVRKRPEPAQENLVWPYFPLHPGYFS